VENGEGRVCKLYGSIMECPEKFISQKWDCCVFS
jgi:hypothetical protein